MVKTAVQLTQHIRALAEEPKMVEYLEQAVYEMCLIDTSTNYPSDVIKTHEDDFYDYVVAKIQNIGIPGCTIEKLDIPADIARHKAYSIPFYAKDANSAYEGRYNLLASVTNEDHPSGRNVAINAHVDTVSPHFEPSRGDGYILGRGSSDDKGSIAVMFGVMKILKQLAADNVIQLKNRLSFLFVTDEEIGGNGSLAIAMNTKLRSQYDSMLILECADNELYISNRGAIFFKCELSKQHQDSASDLLGASAYCLSEILAEGRAIKKESDHPLYPQRPVQTCLGILDSFGVHPSAICSKAVFSVSGIPKAKHADVFDLIDKGVADYVEHYGDKTTVMNEETGKPKLERHYGLSVVDDTIEVTVFGIGGHMGSLEKNDAALSKLTYILKRLYGWHFKEQNAMKCHLVPSSYTNILTFEGAQGFLPTHAIDSVKERLHSACKRGLGEYPRAEGMYLEMSFEKLHNEPFASDWKSAQYQSAVTAARAAGIIDEHHKPKGWQASCDARIFALEYPELPVITSGAGKLSLAHSLSEKIYTKDMLDSLVFTTLYCLLETGSVVK